MPIDKLQRQRMAVISIWWLHLLLVNQLHTMYMEAPPLPFPPLWKHVIIYLYNHSNLTELCSKLQINSNCLVNYLYHVVIPVGHKPTAEGPHTIVLQNEIGIAYS